MRTADADTEGRTDGLDEMWAESVRRDAERRRRTNAAAWYEFYSRLADSHARISEEFGRRALALLDEPEGTER